MPKTINTKISYGFDVDDTNWTGIEDSRTYGTYTGGWWGIYPPYYEYTCPYRLPCGDCQRTCLPCHHQMPTIEKYEITCDTKTED